MGGELAAITSITIITIYLCVILPAILTLATSAFAAPVHLMDETPVSIQRVGSDVILVDFGRVAFGNIQLMPPTKMSQSVTVHFGEVLKDGRINRQPKGTVRYCACRDSNRGIPPVVVAPPADKRNTKTGNPHTPPEWGVVLPFRWVEIEGWPDELSTQQIVRKSAYAESWDDDAAAFECSDKMLNRIWELCRHSIKATTFAGVYVDGDRERIPYEADAYINQLSHYYTDSDIQMARDTYRLVDEASGLADRVGLPHDLQVV